MIFENSRLVFKDHLEIIFKKVSKKTRLFRKFRNLLSKKLLVTISKPFIRPHLGYGDNIYGRAYNDSFYRKLQIIQYNDALDMISAIRGTSKEKLDEKLCSESL